MSLRIRLSPEEIAGEFVEPATRLLGVGALHSAGVLILENAFRRELIEGLHAEFTSRYAGYLHDREYPDALRVGDKRTMVTVRLEGPFAAPQVFANPLVASFAEALLGPDCILGSFGVVASVPGAADQHVHRDHAGLFLDETINSALPCYAINMIVPLIEFDQSHGTTRIWTGSHRFPLAEVSEKNTTTGEHKDPVIPVGGCMLMDYRLAHAGTANHSTQVRSIVYISYHRPWFRDDLNFGRQPAVVMTAADHERIDPEHRRWLAAATLI